MDGYDLRCVFDRQADLTEFMKEKIKRLNFKSEPFWVPPDIWEADKQRGSGITQ